MRVESNAASGGSQTSAATTQQSDMFMKLLMAQLKSQDPMSPMDANSFVDQMVQFNTLEQITEIRQLVEYFSTGSTPAEQ